MKASARRTIEREMMRWIIPLCVLGTIFVALWAYRELYRAIDHGFDRKLLSAATTTAAFLDPIRHEALLEGRSLRALTWLASQDQFVGLDAKRRELVTVDPEVGIARSLRMLPLEESLLQAVNGISFRMGTTELRLAITSPPTVFSFDLLTEEVVRVEELPQEFTFVGFLEERDGVYLAKENSLFLLESEDREPSPVFLGAIPGIVSISQAIYFDGDVVVLGADTSGIPVLVPLASGEPVALWSAAQDRDISDERAPPEGTWNGGAPRLARGSHVERLFGVTDQLVRIDPRSGEVTAHPYVPRFREREGGAYESLIKPMRRILAVSGLTDHYTSVLSRDGTIQYVLDATEGDEHSELATVEANPDGETERLREIVETARPSVSGIQAFDIWGPLKIGTAPIVNADGDVVGLVGADVNISVIKQKTRYVVLIVFGIGAFGVLVALGATRMVAGALHVAFMRYYWWCLEVARASVQPPHGSQEEVPRAGELELEQHLQDLATSVFVEGPSVAVNALEAGTREAVEAVQKLTQLGSAARVDDSIVPSREDDTP